MCVVFFNTFGAVFWEEGNLHCQPAKAQTIFIFLHNVLWTVIFNSISTAGEN